MFRLIFFLLIFACSKAHADTLTILNWEEYLSEEVIALWGAKTGHKIKQIYFDNDEDRDEIVINHKSQIIDLVLVDEAAARLFGEKNIYFPVKQATNFPNAVNLDPVKQKSCGDYGVAYLWGTLGLVYRSDKVSPPRSWDVILNPDKNLKGHIGYIDDYVDMLAPALLTMNISVNTDSPNELKQAFEMVKAAVPSILTFTYSISFVENPLTRDELWVAMAYSGDQYALNEKMGKEVWEYTTLEEGTVHWVDCMSVMSSSPRKEMAFDFLNYILSPEIAAKNSEQVYFASPVVGAKKLQSPEFLADQTVYPSDEVMANAQGYEVLSRENNLLRNRITSSLIKVHESK